MLLLALVACADPEPVDSTPAAEAPFAPAFGAWTARLGQTWGGDCVLADDATYLPDSQTWTLEADRYGFAVRDEVGYRLACVLDGLDFSCDLPDIEDDFSSIGYDVYAVYAYSYVGAFTAEDALSGVYRLEASCAGEDCDLLTGYGEDFRFPCTAEASLEASYDAD